MASPGFMRVSDLVLRPDAARTVLRPFEPGDVGPVAPGQPNRAQRIVNRVLAVSDGELDALYTQAMDTLSSRHRGVEAVLRRRFEEIQASATDTGGASDKQALLIGAYFTEEYAFESTALFNPSAVIHPSQEGVAEGDTRFIMSLRGIGEGHVSSLAFRTAVWRADDSIELDEPSAFATGPDIRPPTEAKRTAELTFDPSLRTSEMVVFPFLPSQGRGIEDVRLCHFTEDDGSTHYKGTFTAFNGMETRQAVLRTSDFRRFVMRGLDGDLFATKGMAWFPRRIDGKWWMLSRQDNESVWVTSSEADRFTWGPGTRVIQPKASWEFIQMGNCGSPIEIDEGWLVLTHGVGDVRTYCMGASLLDKTDPTKLLARLSEPLLAPEADERSGYVPNVVYSCGGLLRGRKLLIPYGVADQFTAFGVADVDQLLRCMS